MSDPILTNMMEQAVHLSKVRHQDVGQRWARLAWHLQFQEQRSLIEFSKIGEIDCLLRGLEDELASIYAGTMKPPTIGIFAAGLQIELSHAWVLLSYDAIRILKSITPIGPSKIQKLKKQFDLVRMPLAKGEVHESRKGDVIVHRPYIMFNSETGSIVWEVYDRKLKIHEIARRELSDQFLELVDSNKWPLET